MISLEAISDLEILDYLEIYGSTVECAKKLNISQSSCSRRYRAFSEMFNLDFDNDGESYGCSQNLDVLTSLREAAQKLRIRSGSPRVCQGWQLGDHSLVDRASGLREVEIRPMNSWTLLSLLDRRLIDLAVMGLYEFQSLLDAPLDRLKRQRLDLSASVQCVPVCRWSYTLVARADHPLQGRTNLTAKDLARFPSPSLPLGVAPHLMVALQRQGLANHTSGLHNYESGRWEGFAADGHGLSYCSPAMLPKAASTWSLSPLQYKLGIHEWMAVVGQRDVLGDSRFPDYLKVLWTNLKGLIPQDGSQSGWLAR
jgi:DNA-binding transcriptional LysR family regulator